MEEQWRRIKGINACYEISNHGCVRGYGRNASTTISYVVRDNALRVILRTGIGKQLYWRTVARLVLDAFAPVDHANFKAIQYHNGDLMDCRLGNLTWGASRFPRTKLTEDDVRQIRARWMAGESYVSLAKIYPVTKITIADLINGRIWAHVS
jgi:hypothetical protein